MKLSGLFLSTWLVMLATFLVVALVNNSIALPLPSASLTLVSTDGALPTLQKREPFFGMLGLVAEATSSSTLFTPEHAQPNPYHCQLCSRLFFREEIFRRHLAEHQYGKLPHHCPQCNGQWAHPTQFQQHLKSHRVLACPNCSKEFRMKSDFAIHRSRQACQKVKTCVFCGETCRSAVAMNRHRTQCDLSPKTNGRCPYCSRDFQTRVGLDAHIYRITDTQQSRTCDLCNARVDNACLQAIHLNTCPFLQEAKLDFQ
ncbi:hypothetical protein H4R33_005400 [Dimargaris cristalligena]|nr:hypothetical protein H4R33_005400 [Dimargaris cristalligena]